MNKGKAKRKIFSEADIEARLLVVMQKVFPWLDPKDFRFQTTFTFKLGHSSFKVDGKKVSRAQGRADVIVSHEEIPVAIFELKRPGWSLTEDDFKQGQSYSRFLTPPPPLIILSNGAETRIRRAHDGKDWPPEEASEQRLAQTISAAMKVTEDQHRDAVGVLIGPNSNLWVQAVRESSRVALEELSGNWTEVLQPLVRGFQIKRNATTELMRALAAGKRTLLVVGEPLSGKTNVLRELVGESESSKDFVVLYLDLHASVTSVFRAVAYLLEAALAWPATDDEARQWILRLSRRTDGPTLVVAIDGLNSAIPSVVDEVGELASAAFGSRLRIVATFDGADERQLTHDPVGRTHTRIGRTAAIVRVGALSDEEFRAMVSQLADFRIYPLRGAERSAEWRLPWVIRALVAKYVNFDALENERLAAVLPPFLGVDLLQHAVDRFSDAPSVREAYGQLAKAVIRTLDMAPTSITARLEFMSNFALDYDVVREVLPDPQIADMHNQGYWRREYKGGGKSILVPRLPELLASEVAQQLADELEARSKADSRAAAEWLVHIGSNLPFGPLIAAAALLDAGSREEALAGGLVRQLVDTPPRGEKAEGGMKFATLTSSGLVNVTVLADGKLELSAKGIPPKVVDADDIGDIPELLSDVFPWLILSYVASTRMDISSEAGGPPIRGDYQLLLQLGSCPMILRGAEGLADIRGHFSHKIEGHGVVACHKNGIIEPITESMRLAILRDGVDSDSWVSAALASRSVPLMMRLLTALNSIEEVAYPPLRAWVGERVRELNREIDKVHLLDH